MANLSNEPVILTVCQTAEEALVIESLLTSEGIACMRREDPASLGEGITGQAGTVPSEAVAILVMPSQLDQAKEILRAAQESASDDPEAESESAAGE